ncbi:MAG: ATP-binding cassette domain-containing protein [Burkholderiaceae bacterium]
MALQGESGYGKSTLLRCLYGSYEVNARHILLHQNGQVVDLAKTNPSTILPMRHNRSTVRSDLATDAEQEIGRERARETASRYLEKRRLPVAHSNESISPVG